MRRFSRRPTHTGRVDLFAYLRLIVKEAQRHESDGWRAYDVMFRKLAATNRTLKWGQPLPSLYATSFTTSRSSALSVCASIAWKVTTSPRSVLSHQLTLQFRGGIRSVCCSLVCRPCSLFWGRHPPRTPVRPGPGLQIAQSANDGTIVPRDARVTRYATSATHV